MTPLKMICLLMVVIAPEKNEPGSAIIESQRGGSFLAGESSSFLPGVEAHWKKRS
jgi:hypothetical protein